MGTQGKQGQTQYMAPGGWGPNGGERRYLNHHFEQQQLSAGISAVGEGGSMVPREHVWGCLTWSRNVFLQSGP